MWRALGVDSGRCEPANNAAVVSIGVLTTLAGHTDATTPSSKRSGIGSYKTHYRTGTCGMPWFTRCAAVCDMRRGPHNGQSRRGCS